MNTHADKTQENKSQSVSNGESQIQSGGESTFQFVDNRPEAIAQRKLQEMANNSPQVKQLQAFQEMANNSPQAKQAAQLQAMADNKSAQQQSPIQRQENNTGLPDNLKTGIENLSGYSMDDVKVHRNSDKPAQLQAHAYAQGTDIHLGPGQEKHLPHEAWHVVQQKQGRVKPTMQMKGKVNVNDDVGLEKEADAMGLKASNNTSLITKPLKFSSIETPSQAVQRAPQTAKIVWMVTHVVKEMDESLFGRGGFEEREIGKRGELTKDQKITIDDSDIFVSRRGPNQEDPAKREQNRKEAPSIEWFRVLLLHGEDVSGENLYIRSGTFIPIESIEEMPNIEDSSLDPEVKGVMQNYQKVVEGYGDGSGIKSAQDFERLFKSAGIQGSLHEGENAGIMNEKAGRTSLINVIEAALNLALTPMKDSGQTDIRDKLLSQGFLATGCVAARITELSEILGKTIRILDAVQHREDIVPFDKADIAKTNIHNCIKGIFEQYHANDYRANQLKKYQSQMQACSAAYGVIAVLSHLNSIKDLPQIIIPLYNNLCRMALKLAGVSNLKKVENSIMILAEEYGVYSDLLIKTFPVLQSILGAAIYPDEIDEMSDHMIYGTVPKQ